MRNILSKAIAEGIGTFALVFAGCGSLMVAERFPGSLPSLAIPLIFGLVVAAMVYAVGHISGAHFNPAVTLGFSMVKYFPKKQVIIYWISQIFGALVAIGLLSILLPKGKGFGETIPVVSSFQAVIWEGILTFFLMFVISAVATDARAEGTMAGAAIGATVMFSALLAGPITGASMNPARSFASAFFGGNVKDLWIYIVGPMGGAVAAALTYKWIRCESSGPTHRENAPKGCC